MWASILVLSANLTQLVNYTGFAVVLFAGIAVAALFVLRRREPSAERPFKALGYPIVPGFFVLASAGMVIAEINRVPKDTLAGLAVIAVGIPVYFLFARKKALRP